MLNKNPLGGVDKYKTPKKPIARDRPQTEQEPIQEFVPTNPNISYAEGKRISRPVFWLWSLPKGIVMGALGITCVVIGGFLTITLIMALLGIPLMLSGMFFLALAVPLVWVPCPACGREQGDMRSNFVMSSGKCKGCKNKFSIEWTNKPEWMK